MVMFFMEFVIFALFVITQMDYCTIKRVNDQR
jgi:hypothetical protein